MVRRVGVVQKRFEKGGGGAAAPVAPPLNPPMRCTRLKDVQGSATSCTP